MEKSLVLDVVEIPEVYGQASIIISKQLRRSRNFFRRGGRSSNKFIATNGLKIESSQYPTYDHLTKSLYVRGENTDLDNSPISCRVNHLNLIFEAVQEYNSLLLELDPPRSIKLKITTLNEWESKIEIVDQNHMGNDFALRRGGSIDTFISSDQYSLHSASYPEYYSKNGIYVRGTSSDRDDCAITIPNEELPRLTKAVQEYNDQKGEY